MTNGQINHLNDPEKIMNEITIMKSVRHVSKLGTGTLTYSELMFKN